MSVMAREGIIMWLLQKEAIVIRIDGGMKPISILRTPSEITQNFQEYPRAYLGQS